MLYIEFSNIIKKMDENFGYLTDQRWMRVGDLMIDIPSMEKGFHDEERRRQEIWDYIQYRESLLKWPSTKNSPSSPFRNCFGMNEKLSPLQNGIAGKEKII